MASKRNIDVEDEMKKNLGGWFNTSGGYTPLPSAIPELPVGVYDATVNFSDKPILAPKSMTTDVLLDIGGLAKMLTVELESFIEAIPRYEELEVQVKRGYLLYGDPGTGKSSALAILAEEAKKRDWIVVYVHAAGSGIKCLKAIRELEKERLILVLIEDIDQKSEGDEEGLLSMLEGPDQIDRFVCVVTTNADPDSLPPRLTKRPGRFDRVIRADVSSLEERVAYLNLRCPKIGKKLALEIAALTDRFPLSHLKEVVVRVYCLGEKPAEAAEEVRKLLSVRLPPPAVDENGDVDEPWDSSDC